MKRKLHFLLYTPWKHEFRIWITKIFATITTIIIKMCCNMTININYLAIIMELASSPRQWSEPSGPRVGQKCEPTPVGPEGRVRGKWACQRKLIVLVDLAKNHKMANFR